jgi:hypothetical protein
MTLATARPRILANPWSKSLSTTPRTSYSLKMEGFMSIFLLLLRSNQGRIILILNNALFNVKFWCGVKRSLQARKAVAQIISDPMI